MVPKKTKAVPAKITSQETTPAPDKKKKAPAASEAAPKAHLKKTLESESSEKKVKTSVKKASAKKKVETPAKETAAAQVKTRKAIKTRKEAVHSRPVGGVSDAAVEVKHTHPKAVPEVKTEVKSKESKKSETAVKPEQEKIHPASKAEATKAEAPKAEAPKAEVPKAEAPKPEVQAKPVEIKGEIKINELSTVRELSDKMRIKPGDLIKKLITMGSLATINQRLDMDTATLLAHEFGYNAVIVPLYAEEALAEEKEDPANLKPRSPVVTIMGHVDHGKTSLLDAIRESRIADKEAGGITQHIGAYKVITPKGGIAFLDTPGHEAFTAMRSRGAKATDIVILVVSAADGVMPQTVEAIDHARAANVPIIVAINKIDLPTANVNQVRQELTKYNLVSEEWGGDTIMVEVSAKKNININELLDLILLKAEMMELKANPDKPARGVIVEARLDPRRGPVATLLVQSGTLRVGDNFIAGITFGKVRAMTDEHGQRLVDATPGTPVEILGITSTPQAGDQFIVVTDERQAREISNARANRAREDSLRPRHHLTLEDIATGKVKELRLILKTDVQGSLGALRDSLERLANSEINLNIIHAGVGAIIESDITLAAASDALIIGFNIRPDTDIEKMADHEGVSIRTYRIIYEAISEVKSAMEGLLEPHLKEVTTGKAAVRQVFKLTKYGIIAGCIITEGKIVRTSKARLVRDNVIVFEGAIGSLRRFKDDVKEVEKGFECGISLENFSDIKPGDLLEAFVQEKVARKLEG